MKKLTKYVEECIEEGAPGKIKKSRQGLLHKKMGVAKSKTIPTGDIEAKKAAAKKSGDKATVKQTTFALNARKWNK